MSKILRSAPNFNNPKDAFIIRNPPNECAKGAKWKIIPSAKRVSSGNWKGYVNNLCNFYFPSHYRQHVSASSASLSWGMRWPASNQQQRDTLAIGNVNQQQQQQHLPIQFFIPNVSIYRFSFQFSVPQQWPFFHVPIDWFPPLRVSPAKCKYRVFSYFYSALF